MQTMPSTSTFEYATVPDVWIEQLGEPVGSEPVVFNPQGGQNKPYLLSPEQLTALGVPQVVNTVTTSIAEGVDVILVAPHAPDGTEPVVYNLQQPTHCDEVWLEMPAAPQGTESFVLNVAETLFQNKSVDLTPDLLMQWGLPSTEVAATVDSVFSQFKLSAADVLQVPADAATGKHVLHVFGGESDTLTLSQLVGSNAAAGQWVDTGVVQQDGASFHSYGFSMDPSLQVLVDTHMHNVTVS